MALRRGTLNAPVKVTVREAAEEWVAEAERGVVRTRSGDRYKPSALRSYRQVLKRTILPELGHLRLSALTRGRLQDLIDRMVGDGLGPSTVRNTVLPLRAIYRRALLRGLVVQNPTLGLSLPAHRPKRDRVARPAEADALLRALPGSDRGGPPPSTPVCAAESSRRFAGPTSTSSRACSASSIPGTTLPA